METVYGVTGCNEGCYGGCGKAQGAVVAVTWDKPRTILRIQRIHFLTPDIAHCNNLVAVQVTCDGYGVCTGGQNGSGSGTDNRHPSAADHQRNADIMVPYLKTLLGIA